MPTLITPQVVSLKLAPTDEANRRADVASLLTVAEKLEADAECQPDVPV